MTSELLNNDFGLVVDIKEKNSFEKKQDDFYLTIRDPQFSIVDDKGQTLKSGTIPMVGLFHKVLSNIEVGELRILAEYLLNNKKYVVEESNVDTLVKVTQGQHKLSGGFLASSTDIQNALFLRKRFSFVANQLAHINKFEPINAISFRHELQLADKELLVKFYVKNIGQQEIKLVNPYTLFNMERTAPHLWFGIIFQGYLPNNHRLVMPDYSLQFKEEHVSKVNLESAKKHPTLMLAPNEELSFSFVVNPQLMKEKLLKDELNTRLTIAFPFTIGKATERLLVLTDEQPLKL